MPNTTNFNWATPADTDLVKDGAAAIRTLGNSIDSSFVDLKGGTTGQILSKASNADLDYTWINNDQGDITAVTAGTGITGGGTTGSVTITNDMATTITASGDLIVGTGNATYDNLPIGTTGQVLTADTTVSPYKVKWANVSGGFTKISTTSFGAVSSQDIDNLFSSSYNNYLIVVNYFYGISDNQTSSLSLRLRYSTTTKTSGYYSGNRAVRPDGTSQDGGSVENGAQFTLCQEIGKDDRQTSGHFFLQTRGGSSSRAFINGQWFRENGTGGGGAHHFSGSTREDQIWTGIRLAASGGSNIYGEVTVYGMSL